MAKFDLKQEYMSVSIDFIERLMPSANPTFVKVYLYALMLCFKKEDCDSYIIAEKLGLLESDVILAMKYWEEQGILNTIEEKQSDTVKEAIKIPMEKNVDVEKISRDTQSNEDLKDMLRIAQEVLGKTLTSSDTKTLYWIHENLGMSIEVILVLLEYCVSINKRNMAYIEQVALSWSERGINTLEDADVFMREQAQKDSSFSSLKRIFGINSRDFTSIELNYLNNWTSVYKMSEDMIALAYEYCILQINKLSFPYMDKIIENWYASNIHTIAEAEADNEKFKNKTETKNTGDFDLLKTEESMDDFEKRMWEKANNED